MKAPFQLARTALLVGGALGISIPAQSGQLTIATDPLGTGTTSIKPNVMFILDDSGSMGSSFMPDEVIDSHSPPSSNGDNNFGTASCFDAGDDSAGTISGDPDACVFGDPPFNSPEINTIYYNPDIRYRPAVNADGTEMIPQTSANTAGWTTVLSNPFLSVSTSNIITSYLDRVWCTAQSDAAGGTSCRPNSAYQYPNSAFPYGRNVSGNVKYVNGSPYYYRAKTAQWCSDAARTSCRSGSAIDPALDSYQAAEFCTDPELTNCAAGAGVTAAHVFSGIRYCADAGTLLDCQRKKTRVESPPGSGTYKFYVHPKHLGTTKAGTVPARSAEGNILVSSVVAAGGTINSITINGVTATSGAIPVPAGSTNNAVANLIFNAINSGPLGAGGTNAYTALAPTGSNVAIQSVATGTAPNGRAIVVSVSQNGTTAARGRITITNAGNSNTITSLTVNGQQLLTCAPASDQSFTVSGRTAYWRIGGGTSGAASRIEAPTGATSDPRVAATRNALRAAIAACGAYPPGQPSGGTTPFTYAIGGSGSSQYIDITAPVSLGSIPNGWVIAKTGPNVSATLCALGDSGGCSGTVLGAYSSTIVTSTTALAGGASSFSGTVRVGVGQLARTDIVSGNNSYPKAVGRVDCVGATCTFDEEMTNFANWFAYHRTRMHMMKSAVGRAFREINQSFRVGMITICPVSGNNCATSSVGVNVDANKYLRIADFDGTQKAAFYAKLYAQAPANFTPLREALSRVGLIFAGKVGTNSTGLTGGLANADDPVTASCQPNFSILSTDGYWNGGPGKILDASDALVDVGNQDNQNVTPYSLQTQGVFDGSTPTATNTLGDVALYYYKTDLRPAMNNTVPVTQKDPANHQHMVTFTLGLGLDGELSYRADYETASTGDFVDIKSGARKWPVPAAGQPSSLDDLWHAAVNGRGVFFSAKDPDQLAVGLAETLNQLQARVGAGAAAATSNLQPVAGDNFAFTAQYQTNDWIGDLRGRTIDLSNGVVSSVALWSAASLLSGREHVERQIFTFDPGDAAGNKLKHFCMPADVGATWCNDGAGLTAAEQAYFNPSVIALTQEPSWTSAGTTGQMVAYLRGDNADYNTGSSPRGPNDLFRRRVSLLGDVVNAQPAYVRKSPFQYGDTGYTGFKACTEGLGTSCEASQHPTPAVARRGTVYTASNDGMLHAFETDVNNNPYYQTAGISSATTADDTFSCDPAVCNVGNGGERWAYVPSIVLPNLHVLANEPYVHRYFVDGTPAVGDICITTPCADQDDWRTIVVAGLNSGGRGYYALDVTNPLAPKALWEFTYTSACVTIASTVPVGVGPFTGDCHVGLSFGNPIITKMKKTGKWVVMLSSGYNNGSADGNGNGLGYLYVLDAMTGAIMHRIATTAGTAASPSGLAKLNGWTTNGIVDNTTLAIYGGDLDGHLWRFDFDWGDISSATPTNAGYLAATLVARVKDAASPANFQPITVKPELGEYATKRIIMFGTGKFLEGSDKTSTAGQTIYALRDDPAVSGTTPGAGCDGVVVCDVRVDTTVRPRSFAAGSIADTRTVSPGTAPTWATEFGWRIDLPESGERVNVDPQLQLGTLVIATNIPSTDTCTAGGSSFINFLDYATGGYVPGSSDNVASVKIGSSLTVGLNVIMLPGGKVEAIITTADNQQLTKDTPVASSGFTGRRVSWRELVKEQ